MPQFIYVASVLYHSDSNNETINKMILSFVNTGSTLTPGKGNWIHQDILYGSKSEGGLNFIDARNIFMSLKISWIKRYAMHIIDRELKLTKRIRAQILTWGPEDLTCMKSNNFPCIEGFFKAWLDFKTSFLLRPTDMHNNLLHSPIFFNPCILQNLSVKDFAEYGKKKPETTLKKLSRNPGLRLTSNGVILPSDKMGRTPLDYVSCPSDSFKRINRGSNHCRKMLLLYKLRGTTTYKTKIEKRLGVTVKQSYVNRIMAMLNS